MIFVRKLGIVFARLFGILEYVLLTVGLLRKGTYLTTSFGSLAILEFQEERRQERVKFNV